MTKGWQTTEFWVTLVPQALTVLVVLGVIKPGDKDTLEGAIINAVSAVGILATSATTLWQYIRQRTALKESVARMEMELKTREYFRAPPPSEVH